jgi:DNA-binding transcriptional regulator GbsR (MarR family)
MHSDPNIERPTMSLKDAMAALPGTSGFVSRSYESGLKNDFYVLRDEVAKVANTMSDLKQKNPEKIEEYLSSEEIMARYGMAKSVGKITKQLGDIRKNISQITNAPKDVMSGDEKEAQIKELRALETDMLKAINTKELRSMAKL